MRKITLLAAWVLVAACTASPTSAVGAADAPGPRWNGFTMGSGNRDGGEETRTATAAGDPEAVADSATVRGGFTMGSGN